MAAPQLSRQSGMLIEPQRPTAGLWMMDNKKDTGGEEVRVLDG